jgi:hypothetical protein
MKIYTANNVLTSLDRAGVEPLLHAMLYRRVHPLNVQLASATAKLWLRENPQPLFQPSSAHVPRRSSTLLEPRAAMRILKADRNLRIVDPVRGGWGSSPTHSLQHDRLLGTLPYASEFSPGQTTSRSTQAVIKRNVHSAGYALTLLYCC